jgi:hypothetical protein
MMQLHSGLAEKESDKLFSISEKLNIFMIRRSQERKY